MALADSSVAPLVALLAGLATLGCGPRAAPSSRAPAPPPSASPALVAAPAPACVPAPARPTDAPWFAVGASAPLGFPAALPDAATATASVWHSAQPVAVRDAEGRIVVAWGSPSGVLSRAFTGGRWVDLPPIPIANAESFALSPALALDRQRRPIAYFFEGERVRVFRLEGSSWNDTSPRSNPPARRFSPPSGPQRTVACPAVVTPVAPTSLAVDAEGRPVIAWAEPGPERMRLIVFRFTGAAWASSLHPDIGPVNLCAPHSMPVSLSLDPEGKPLVVYRDDRAMKGLYWNGRRFTEHFTYLPPHETVYGGVTQIAFSPSGALWLATSDRVQAGPKILDHIDVGHLFDNEDPRAKIPPDRPLLGQVLAFEVPKDPLVAAYEYRDGAARIRVVSLEPSGLRELTGKPEEQVWQGTIGSVWPAVVLPHQNEPPVIVHRVSAIGDTAIVAQEWAPGGFRALGGPPADVTALGEGIVEGDPPAISMRNGRIAVAWLSEGTSPSIAVRLWDGCTWQSLPPIAAKPNALFQHRPPFISLDASGMPVVAWSTGAARLRGGAWEALDLAALQSQGIGSGALSCGLVVGEGDTPTLGFAGPSGSATASRKGDTWIVEAPYRGPLGTMPALAEDTDGRAVVGTLEWKERNAFVLYVRRLEGSRWVDLPPWTGPQTSQSGFPPDRVALTAGPAGRVAFAFRRSTGEPATLSEWNGSSWSPISTIGPGGHPSLAYDAAGRLHVAFSDRASGEIHVKRLSAGAFVDAPGAPAPRGISATEARSVDPAMASDGDLLCVVWSETSVGRGRVLLRCHAEKDAPP